MSVTRINHFEAKEDTVDQLHIFMEGVVEKVKNLPGCRSVRLLRSTENPAHLAIVEEWDSIEDHQRAATTIPPDLLEKAKTLVAAQPMGEYFK
jgi:quinol monooxygenase YgiN